jgi:hypothetical protein
MVVFQGDTNASVQASGAYLQMNCASIAQVESNTSHHHHWQTENGNSSPA